MRFGLGCLLIFGATLCVYRPALQAGFVWNDSDYVTAPALQSWHGLWRIWFEVGATQQYYPLLHSAFWVEHRLWGNAPAGYHLVNILLHATSACLFIQVLRRVGGLGLGAALLAGLIFALHPVGVESVAWITEQKNTLSTVFYLLAALAYFRFQESRRRGPYVLGLALFAAAALTKSVAATLPGALLVLVWWQHGRLSLRRDVAPLAPWFAIGAAAGLFTAWVERTYLGAQGAAFALTPLDRCLVAGRVIWFYLGKLLWPVDLIFIYRRWQVDAQSGWQYLFPLGVLALLTGLAWLAWRRRSRTGRAPLAAALLFIGGLFPLLGFFNVYAFKFSYVADHWQYLAMPGVIALLAGAWELWRRVGPSSPLPEAAAVVVVAVLGVLSWRQSREYHDLETFYRTILAKNPECWMAQDNLGRYLGEHGHYREALARCETALQLNPGLAEAELNLGATLAAIGQGTDAIHHYEAALRLRPDYAQAQCNLGVALAKRGQYAAALDLLTRASRLLPGSAEIQVDLGNISYLTGRFPEAIDHFETALRLQPDYAGARENLLLARAAGTTRRGGHE